MITEGQFYDLRSRVALIEADNPTGKTFQPFDEGRGQTFIPEATTKQQIPDTNGTQVDSATRKTIERNPTAGAHFDEWQMRNVGTTPNSSTRIPQFVKDANGGGDIEWVAKDVVAASLPWTNGYVITQGATPTVSFTTGYLIWGLTRYTVGNTGSHNITTNNWWGIKMTSGGSAEWIEHASVNDFQDDASSFQQEYYQFQIVGGVASIKAVAACGNWKVPSVFAPE